MWGSHLLQLKPFSNDLKLERRFLARRRRGFSCLKEEHWETLTSLKPQKLSSNSFNFFPQYFEWWTKISKIEIYVQTGYCLSKNNRKKRRTALFITALHKKCFQ